jgi:AsmA protein
LHPRRTSISVTEHAKVISATGLKRLGIGIAALIGVVVGAFALVPILIPADSVREAVQAEIRAVTGLKPVLRGDATVSLFPSARVILDDVALGDAGAADAALTAERLSAQLRLLPLLVGRIEIADVSLFRPRIAVTFDAQGRSNWSALIDTLARTLKPDAKRGDRLLSFSEIRVADGTVFVHDERHGIAETLADVGLSLAWPSISQSFGATGVFLWRNEPVDLSLTLSDFFAAIAGNRSGLKVRLTGAPLKFAFDGHMSHSPTLKIEGMAVADAASLRQALRWTGLRSLPGGGLGRFALRAQTTVAASGVAMSRVNLELDGNVAEGVLTFSHDGRPLLQGTLATEALDLSPYVSTLRLLARDEREWSAGHIALSGISAFDVDLRLSAARIALIGAKLGRTAIAANLRGGRVTVTIGESQAFGGVLKGSMGFAKSELGVDVKAQLLFSDVDLESCLGELFAVRRLEGRGNLALAFDASGASVLGLTRTMNGQASLTATQGAIAGLNLEQMLRRLERRPLSGAGDFRAGRTPFEKLNVVLKINQGTANVQDVALEGAAVRLALGGSASIPTRDLDLKGTATLVSSTTSDAAGFELPFAVQGRWEDPIMLPDAQMLIRRSGAAAPLLDAVRERRARDAVRSAIENLTRGPNPGPMPAGATTPAPPPGAVPDSQ